MKLRWHLSLPWLTSLLVGCWAVSSAVGTGLNLPLLQWLELQTQTLFYRMRGPVLPPDKVVILAIDDDSLARGRERAQRELAPLETWPWRRRAYAAAIDHLMAAGAQSVSVDIVLDLPSPDPQDDARLRQTLQKYAGRVTLAAVHTSTPTSGVPLEQLIYPTPALRTQPESIGLINYPLEQNGQIRRFAGAYLDAAINPDLKQAQNALIPFAEASLQAAHRPRSAPKGAQIFFYGWQNSFLTVSFWQVLDPQNWQQLQRQQVFKDKIVLIGPTSPFFKDAYPTPFNELPGIEIHANAIATLLEQRSIVEAVPNPPLRGLLLLLGLTGVGFALSRLSQRAVPRFLWSLGIAIAWTGIGYGSFIYGGLILPVTVPVAAILLSGITYLSTGAAGDQLEKLRLRRTFERYVAPSIVEEILSQSEDFQALLQGRKIKAAVLFCDIRGFTSLSYKLPAEELVAQLNTYLNAMVQAISEVNGTIDKFIGDAVMAEFGCPVSRGEKTDAMNAIQAALRMRKALAELRQQWQQADKIPLFHGIGISYGEAIAGNIGSLKRLEYTVIGDSVNVASRVESLTKSFWTDILITESLYTLVQDQVEVVFVGEHSLRGREEASTRLYSLVGLKGEDHHLYRQVHEDLRRYLGSKDNKEANQDNKAE